MTFTGPLIRCEAQGAKLDGASRYQGGSRAINARTGLYLSAGRRLSRRVRPSAVISYPDAESNRFNYFYRSLWFLTGRF